MKHRDLINYKGEFITIRELSNISGISYGTIATRADRYPEYTGEQILAHKTRQEVTYKEVTQSVVEWAEQFKIDVGTLRIRGYAIGISEAVAYYAENKHLELVRGKYVRKGRKLEDANISQFNYDPDLHAQRLLGQGLTFKQVYTRLHDGGLL